MLGLQIKGNLASWPICASHARTIYCLTQIKLDPIKPLMGFVNVSFSSNGLTDPTQIIGYNHLHHIWLTFDKKLAFMICVKHWPGSGAYESRIHLLWFFASNVWYIRRIWSMFCVGHRECPTQMMCSPTSASIYLLCDTIQETQINVFLLVSSVNVLKI